MKVRNGFVSNSSSSSFIISNKKFATVSDLAKYMIKQKMQDEGSNKYDKLLIKNLSKIDKNRNMSFPSCNYDTYIRKVGDCYLVATCNNTYWDLYDYRTILTDNAKEELAELMNKYSSLEEYSDYKEAQAILEGDYGDFSRIGIDYYNLDKEIVGIEMYSSCKKCNENMWNTPKGQICLKCNPYFQRKEKLEIINKKINED